MPSPFNTSWHTIYPSFLGVKAYYRYKSIDMGHPESLSYYYMGSHFEVLLEVAANM